MTENLHRFKKFRKNCLIITRQLHPNEKGQVETHKSLIVCECFCGVLLVLCGSRSEQKLYFKNVNKVLNSYKGSFPFCSRNAMRCMRSYHFCIYASTRLECPAESIESYHQRVLNIRWRIYQNSRSSD